MYRCLLICWAIIVVHQGLGIGAPRQPESLGMVTGSQAGTYIRFGEDIARIAHTINVPIVVKESEGSIDNIRRLVSPEKVAIGIVQSDVLGFLSRSEDPRMRQIARNLRLMFPFYNEERPHQSLGYRTPGEVYREGRGGGVKVVVGGK